jgi:hypothetical protein
VICQNKPLKVVTIEIQKLTTGKTPTSASITSAKMKKAPAKSAAK